MIAEACKKLLEPQFNVVAVVADGRSLLESSFQLKPDVIMIDIAMPGLNGLDAGEQIKKQLKSAKLIYLTMNMAPEIAAEAFQRGASAYVVKQAAASELLVALRKALRGESYLSPLVSRDTVDVLIRGGKRLRDQKGLTPRQKAILQLLVRGLPMKEIARELNLRPSTVSFHKYRIMEIVGVKRNAELITYAIRNHLAEASDSSYRG